MAFVIPGAVLGFFLLLVLLPAPLDAIAAIGVTVVLAALVIYLRTKADQDFESIVYKRSRRAGVDDDEARRRAGRAHLNWRSDE